LFRQRIRRIKRELEIPEGVIERLTPITAETLKIREILRLRIISGVAYGEEAGVWYRIRFPFRLGDPEVVAVSEIGTTTIPVRPIEKVPDITIPTVKRPPEIELKEIERIVITREEIEAEIREQLGDWGIWNWIRDWLAWASSYAAHFIWKVFSGIAIDKIRDAINETIRDFNIRVNQQTDFIYRDLNDTIRRINNKINSQIDVVTGRVNLVLTDLYRIWGLPTNLRMTTVHIRDVTETGFSFLSLGRHRVHWIAVGERR